MSEPQAKRVVTLIASATEIVAALGCADWLVGRSHECDYPASISGLPILTGPKFSVDGTSSEIDRRVKALVAERLSVYRVDADRLEALAPEVIVTQDQCEVCAVSLQDVEQAVCAWAGDDAQIVSLHPDGLEDVWENIATVAAALGVPQRAQLVIEGLTGRLEDIRKACAAQRSRPSVACIEWVDPLMAAGNWVPTLVEIAGGRNLFGEAGKHAPWMSWEELVAADPDVIVALPCGYDIERAAVDMDGLARTAGWTDLSAVRNARVYVADGNQYFNRPGPRLVESAEIFAELLHEGALRYGHEGTGWRHYT